MFGSRSRETVHVLLKHGTLIVQELQAQFKEGRNCDLEIRLGKKRLYVHKCLVDIFFLKAGAELEDDRFFLDLSRYSQTVVEALVGLMYTGKLKCEPSEVENVCLAATELGCVEGLQGCKSYAKDPKLTTIGQGFSSRTPLEKSPEPFQVTFPQVEEADPNIIVKTEPIEDIPAINGQMEPGETNNLAFPAVPDLSSINWPDKHTTLCVPVTGPDAGRPVDFSRPRISTYTTKQAFSTHVVYSTVHPALNNRGRYSINKAATTTVDKSPEQQDNKKKSNKTKKGRPRKNANKKSSGVDKSKSILNLVHGKKMKLKGKKRKSGNQPTVTEIKNKPDLRQLETRSGVATGTETLSEQQNELQDDEDNNEGMIKTEPISNLVKCRTKSGVVYYKEVNPNNLSEDEFSANFDHADVGNISERSKASSSGTESEDTVTNKLDSNLTMAVPAMSKQQDKWAENCNKDAVVDKIAGEGISGATNTESDDETSQRKQMFHLGLERKSDKMSAIPSKSSETSNKRRLRERKKVDYSKFEDGNDSCESEEVVPVKKAKKSPGRSNLQFGERYVEISQETKNFLNAKLSKQQAVLIKTEESGSENEMKHSSDYLYEQKESSPKLKFPDTALTRRAQGTTVAVVQSEDSDDEECAYFPPAATVPKGVRSQYARGNLLKLKTVTEQIYDKDGNVTVITKKIPLRPRQYGLDERLMNRPSVYICHPTAPVIKPVVKRKQYRRTAILTDLNKQ